MYAYKTDFLDCSDDTSIIIAHIFTLVTKIHGASKKKVKMAHTQKKNAIRDSNPRPSSHHGHRPNGHPILFVAFNDRYWYVPIRTNRRLGYFDQKTKTAAVTGRRREHDLGRSLQSRERREKMRDVEQTPRRMVALISSYQ